MLVELKVSSNCEMLQIIRIVACYYPKITTSLRRTGLIKIIKTALLIPDSIVLVLALALALVLATLAALETLAALAALETLETLAVLATLALALAVVISR